jgi:hypothetical protein
LRRTFLHWRFRKLEIGSLHSAMMQSEARAQEARTGTKPSRKSGSVEGMRPA